MGCGKNFFNLVSTKLERSFKTEEESVIKALQLFKKYFVKNESPALFSCGYILSVMAKILILLFKK